MTTLTIEDATYRKLQALAAARRMSVNGYLNEIAGENARTSSDSARQLAALESFSAGMASWTEMNLPAGHVADDSRESIYEDRGE